MPRKSKTLSGAPASAPTTPVDTTYGEGERALEAQRRTPVPDFASGGTAPASPGAGGEAAGGGGNVDRFAQAVEAARAMAEPEGMLSAPSQRPMEPLMQGMGAGPGPKPAAVEFNEALFHLRAAYAQHPEYRGLARLIALAEEQA